jgi:hypothetical protein
MGFSDVYKKNPKLNERTHERAHPYRYSSLVLDLDPVGANWSTRSARINRGTQAATQQAAQ